MKVIFLQDVPAVAGKYDVKDVRDGYARNFLLPRRLAEIATPAALGELDARRTKVERERIVATQRYEKAAEKLKNLMITIAMKVGEGGTTFGSVNAQKIQEALKKEGIGIEKEWIAFEAPIKTTGEHEVSIHFPSDIRGMVKVNVEPETAS